MTKVRRNERERLREKEGGRRDITMADRRLRNNISRQRGKRKKRIYVENNEKEGLYFCGKTGTFAGGGTEVRETGGGETWKKRK